MNLFKVKIKLLWWRDIYWNQWTSIRVVWACEQFRPYLYGREFTIECDHNPLVFLDNMKNKTSRVSRWRYNLAEYKYKIRYVKGKLNTKADALSRAEICTIKTSEIDLVKAQNDDPLIKTLKEHLTNDYFISKNLIYKKN